MTEAPHKVEDRIAQMTLSVSPDALRQMVLDLPLLPSELRRFELLQEAAIDNHTLANRSGGRDTIESLTEAGRLDGYHMSFAVEQGSSTLAEEPADLLEVSTSVHLFEKPDDVRGWIENSFIKRLRDSVGHEDQQGQRITGVELLSPSGFHASCGGLLILQDVPGGELATTVVEFELGRILGVATAVAKVDLSYLNLVNQIGLELERQIVRVVLGG